MPSVNDVCKETGISYRQANHWIEKGWISDLKGVGTGIPLEVNDKQLRTFRRMADLVSFGMKPNYAAHYAGLLEAFPCTVVGKHVILEVGNVPHEQREGD